jgi:hypothetical protein
MKETPLMRQIQAAVSRTGRATMWRNNVGVDVTRGVRYGMGVGSPDLVGFIHGTGRFFALEVKIESGRASEQQRVWLDFAASRGASVYVVRSVAEALKALEDACTQATLVTA